MNIFIAETIGTALLILLGNGVVAACCLKNTKSGPAGWMVITTAWAFAVYVGVIAATALGSGAHLTALRRTQVGDVRVEDCHRLDDFEQWLAQQTIETELPQ